MRGKKCQMEIMGLAIVVILIVLGMFFMIKFVIMKEPSNLRKSYTQSQMASNLLNTYLKTTIDTCSDSSLTQLLQDCAQNLEVPTNQILCSDGRRSCEYLEFATEEIFENTLIEWGNRSYYFYAKVPAGIVLESYNGVEDDNCPNGQDEKQQYIHTSNSVGIMEVILGICN